MNKHTGFIIKNKLKCLVCVSFDIKVLLWKEWSKVENRMFCLHFPLSLTSIIGVHVTTRWAVLLRNTTFPFFCGRVNGQWCFVRHYSFRFSEGNWHKTGRRICKGVIYLSVNLAKDSYLLVYYSINNFFKYHEFLLVHLRRIYINCSFMTYIFVQWRFKNAFEFYLNELSILGFILSIVIMNKYTYNSIKVTITQLLSWLKHWHLL